MARPNRLLRHNILIVCEGESTEPQYFNNLIPLAKAAWSKTHKLYIELSPKPTLDEEIEKVVSKHKTSRKRRQLKQVAKDSPTLEEAYIAVPVRYVREAQQGLEDDTYEEAWAVFDKDGHPKHEEAFKLAEEDIDGNKVKIAFSSISVEQWILLHFEKSLTAFEKSECKDGKKSIKCGTKQHPDDCFGKKCVSGYIANKQYLENYSKRRRNANYFQALHPHFPTALENAAWLRYKILKANTSIPIYQLNPYTNLDYLVKHLLQIQEEIVWVDFSSTIKIPQGTNDKKITFTVWFIKKSSTSSKLYVTNHDKKSYLVLSEHLFVVRGENREKLVEANTLIRAGETKTIFLDTSGCKGMTLNFLLNISENYRIMIAL